MGTERWGELPADLLEDVISADVLDVLVDDGPGALLFGQLPLQPRHHLFVVVPQVGLRSREEVSSFTKIHLHTVVVADEVHPTRWFRLQRWCITREKHISFNTMQRAKVSDGGSAAQLVVT